MLASLSHIDYCLLGALVLLLGYQCYFYLRYIGIANRWQRRHTATTIVAKSECPKVSVIVCARNEQRNLQDYLHALLTQDYPCYEVIVINDGSEDDTQIILERYTQQTKQLYTTFIPRDARVISSKKLALTIGAKAANYDHLLLTDADCRPVSRHWISEMMSGFANPSTEVVLGYGAYFDKPTVLSSLISYDTLFIALQYMGMAAAGKPYMGVGRNLAYKKETFFSHDGFRGMLGEPSGDDDLFVNKVSNKENTAIVCSQASVTWSAPKTSWQEWIHQKRRHLSVSPRYRINSKWRLGIEPMTRGLFYALLITTAVCGSSIAVGIAMVIGWLRLVIQLTVINTSAHRMGTRLFGIEIVAYDIILPIVSLWLLVSQRLRKRRIYW